MRIQAKQSSVESILPLRTRYREEASCQIVHDSIHRREGWTFSYLLELGGVAVGFGSVAIGGPWKDKPTVFEFYVLPEHRSRAFEFFEAFLTASGARFFEVQTSDVLLTVMLHTYGSGRAVSAARIWLLFCPGIEARVLRAWRRSRRALQPDERRFAQDPSAGRLRSLRAYLEWHHRASMSSPTAILLTTNHERLEIRLPPVAEEPRLYRRGLPVRGTQTGRAHARPGHRSEYGGDTPLVKSGTQPKPYRS